MGSQKKAFQSCIRANCLDMASRLVRLEASTQAGIKYGVAQAATVHHDPFRDANAQNRDETARNVLECEKQCARQHWADAEKKPFIGTVAKELCGAAQSRLSAPARRGIGMQ
eukprot:TRINITY_DN23691_c0_g1_i1.p1 TRINITY_DN23691_c0_g1~~TRINITY_DN23691_c0_g1_i1.p1  ORF type:complete len:112 (+),score=18.22 TRINITY_DN23691_c0_g1_i1:192-527(+)